MTVVITRAAADDYFAAENHINAPLWARFTERQHDAAVAHAIRLVSRTTGITTLTNETVDTASQYQPDYACFEQALFMLLNSEAIPNAEETAPHHFGDDGHGEPREGMEIGTLCNEAQAWLEIASGPTIRVIKG